MAVASMQPIYERLNAVAGYNPLTADTFGDWAMEAGDIVKVVRGTEEYNVPVHSSTLVWRGKQRISIDATGKKERDSIAKASARKFRGGAAVRSQHGLYQHFESEDLSIRSEFAIGYESLRVAFENEITSTRSEFRMTSESLRIAFENEISSTRSEFYMTSESLRIEFENEINSTRSEFQMTSESLRIEFENEISSTRSEFRMTSESLRIEFENEINSTRSEFQMTSASLRIEFENEINSTRSEFQMTSESLRIEFESEISSTRADIQVQSDRIGLVVSGTGANARIRPAQIVASINNSSSEVLIAADKVKISGTTTINDVFTVADGHVATKVSMYAMPGTVFNGDHVGSFYYSQQEGGYSVQYGVLKKAEVDGNTLKIWKFGDAEASPSITFSKATTLTGAVGSGTDGNKYTVTASPQGATHSVTVSIEIEGAANPNATVYAKSYVVSPSVSKTQIGSAVEMTLGESTSGKYVELYTGSGTSKIQKGKISTAATYNAGWNYGQTQIVRTTRAATSQETTIKTLDYSERFTIIDTYTKADGTTSEVKYIVASKADRYSDGQTAAGLTINGNKIERALSSSTKSYTMSATSGTWDSGSIPIYAKAGAITVATGSVSLPSVSNFETGSPAGISYTIPGDDTYTNNSDGYDLRGSGSTATVVVVTNGTWTQGDTTVTGTNYLTGTPTALYRKGYTDGVTSGRNAVNIIKSEWSSSSRITFTKSAGTANTKAVKIGSSNTGWSSGKIVYTIKDYEDDPQGVTTNYTITVNLPSATGFSTSAPSGASVTIPGDDTYTNNSSGYDLRGSGSSAKAVMVVKGSWSQGGTSVTGTNYLSGAPTALYRKGYSDGTSAGLSAYYNSSYWQKPNENTSHICYIPNSTNTGYEQWFTFDAMRDAIMSSVTLFRQIVYSDSSGTERYKGMLYWKNSGGTYTPCMNSGEYYWYRSPSTNLGSSKTVYY